MAHITHITATSLTDRTLKALRLHELLGGHAAWSDLMWDEAMTYLDGRLSMPQVVELAQALAFFDVDLRRDELALFSPAKRDRLGPFRKYPPTVLLGMFDHCRLTLWA